MSEIFLLAILVVLSAFFSGVEVALVSVSPIKVKSLLKEGRKGSKTLSKLKKNPRRMIITVLIGSNIANIGAAALATVIATQEFGSSGVGIAAGVMTLIILIFGEIIPKTFAATHAERISLAVASPVLALNYILYPLVVILEWIATRVNRLVKIKKAEPITESDIKAMIEFGVEKKVIDPAEQYIIERAVRFSDITVQEVMILADRIFSLDGRMTIRQALEDIIDSNYSRIPVYTRSKNNITGVIFVKDVMASVQKNRQNKRLQDIAAAPIFVKKSLGIDDTFKLFQDKQTHIALVRDGKKIIGLVTLEDLMEELVGEITDETDVTPSTIIRIDKDTIVAHGNTPVERINKFFNSSLPVEKKDMKLHELIRRYEKKPKRHSRIRIDDLTLMPEDVRDGRIIKVRIIRKFGFVDMIKHIEEHVTKPHAPHRARRTAKPLK